MEEKKKNYSIYIFFFLSIFFIHFYQLYHQHWSGVLDQDLLIIYNSILLNSGLEQEYRDHPAYTTFLINSLIYKFFNIFSNTPSTIDNILNTNNISGIFQYYFYISRTINFFCNLLLILFFYKILKKLNVIIEIRFLICLIFITSIGYIWSFFVIRSENISLFFLILAISAALSKNRNKILNFFIAGIFFAFAMLAKIQIIFLALYLIYLIPNIRQNDRHKVIHNNYLKNYLLLSLLFFFLSYFVFQIYIQKFSRFESNTYLDLVFFTLSFLGFIFYFYFSKNFKENILIFSSLINGFFFLILLIFFLDKIKILQVNDFIFLRITNPIHYMTEFTGNETNALVNFEYILKNIKIFFSDYQFNKIELLLLISLILVNLKNKSVNFIIILIFFINTLIINFRFHSAYYLFYIFIYLIFFIEMLKKMDAKLSIGFTYITLVIFFINSMQFFFFIKNNFLNQILNRENNMLKICNQYKLGSQLDSYEESLEYIKYWHSKIDDKKIKKICDEIT
jgi:hypothetical protein